MKFTSPHRTPAFFATLLLTLTVGLTGARAQAPAAQPQIITVQPARMGSSVTIGGTVVAHKQVTLTAQIPGRVEFIAGKEGDHFKKDDVLVTIDDDQLLAMRRQAVAQYNNALAEIQQAQVMFQREIISPRTRSITGMPGFGLPGLFDQMFVRPMQSFMPGTIGGNPEFERYSDLYTQNVRLREAYNRLYAAQSKIEEIDAKLRDTRSFAPFDGVIVKKYVEVGDTVQPGQPLVEYADLTYLQVKADVPTRLMPGLKVGMMVPARIDVGNQVVQARVAQIYPAADPQRHTVTVKFDLPQGVKGGPGMYAEVMIPDVAAPVNTVPVIPDTAVIWRGSLPAVYVVGKDGKPHLRLVRLGDFVAPGQVSVLSGLRIGERIYATPPQVTLGWSEKPE
ncbi:MAG: efflux RND transporter periplasmic adaptor subunit [Gammaproteobacteria bacterium]|nr:MAG: efflux RND transporter periplasmic adaptor subunit [Gammaproteobacteria bacterium]